ncbi:ATP-binding protein [Thermodesulfobacteriota bacterium]
MENNQTRELYPEKSSFLTDVMAFSINLAIVGGGRTCKFFLELLRNEPFPLLNINIVGVCDIDPSAQGLVLAKEMGIYTTNNFHDLFKIDKLDSIIELTGSREILLEIVRLRPKGVGVLEHNIGRLLRNLFNMNQRLQSTKQDLISTEQELIAEKMFSNFLIQQSTAAIVILNTDFTIVEANDAYLNTVNKSREEVIGGYCYKISHHLDVPCSSSHPEIRCPMVETLRTGMNAHVIHEHPGLDGKPTYCNMTTYPIKNQEGEVVRVIEFWRDITEEFSNRWNKRMIELKSDLQKLVQEDRMISLGKLAASCAHEINNPIQGLLTFSYVMQDILAEGKPDSEDLEHFKSHLSLMSTELERCGNIVSGLLSFSRESSLEYKEIDLNEVIESVLTLTRHKFKFRDIQLSTQLSPELLMVEGDTNQLQQCFLNLIFNAIESMPEGGQLSIVTQFDSNKNNARIEIRDTGYGIPEEIQGHVYDPFFTTKGEGEGTGLGLSIVYGVIKNHKGKIKIDSKVGEGTSFFMDFPTL